MAAMLSMASPIASEAAVTSETSLAAKRNFPAPYAETMSIEEAANQGLFRKDRKAGHATERAVTEGLPSLEKRQWTSDWECDVNNGGMYAQSCLYVDTNSRRQ
jgi:hypothetical protein